MRSRTDMRLYYTLVETPLGWMSIIGCDGRILEAAMPCRSKEDALCRVPENAEESKEGMGDLVERLRLYFEGKPVDFSDIPVAFDGFGEFEQRVLMELMKLPYGTVISYGDLAAAAGSPGAARAVGNTMRKNPIPIIVPCHRVLHADGGLGGYGGGLDMKRKLLALEGVAL